MYLAVTATNMYTQTLPDYTYVSQISAYKYMLWGGGRADVIFYQFQILVCLNHYTFIYSLIMMIRTFLPSYPMGLLIKDILNIQPLTENQALLPVSCKLYNFKLAYNKLAIQQFLSLWSMIQTPYLKALIIR